MACTRTRNEGRRRRTTPLMALTRHLRHESVTVISVFLTTVILVCFTSCVVGIGKANAEDRDIGTFFRGLGAAASEQVAGSWWSWSSLTNGVTDMACKLARSECCRSPYVKRNEAASILRKRLKAEFFGQHLAQETVITALDAHLQDPNPGKALVMSFHGWAGSGKTYLAEMLIESLYQKGMQSSYYKFYLASLHFPDEKKVKKYQEELRMEIKQVLRSCQYGVFIFDEVDKTPPGVFDAIVPFIEYPGTIENTLDHKRAIFIFLSNTGSNEITAITMDGWKAGKRREELTFRDYEQRLLKEAFNNAENGLFRSRLIDRVLVDYFVPFLPMERKHIFQCIEAELKRHGRQVKSTKELEEYGDIADALTYWPADLKLYSISGCKRIEAAVKYRVMKEKHLREESAKATGEEDEADEDLGEDKNEHEQEDREGQHDDEGAKIEL